MHGHTAKGNLADREQNVRLRVAVIGLALTLALAVFVIRSDLPVAARWALFIPFLFVTQGAYQGLYRTCFFAAHCGVRVDEHGKQEAICNKSELDRVRKDGKKVIVNAVGTAALATVICVLMP